MKELKFSENLKLLRKTFKISQKELAQQLNVDQRTISAWENNVCEPSFSTLLQLCEIFNETVDSLLT